MIAGRRQIGVVEFFVFQARHCVVRRFKMNVGDQHHIDFEARLNGMELGTLFIQQIGGDINRHLGVDSTRVFFHRLFLQDAQDMQGGGFNATDMTDAMAARAGDMAAFSECRAQTLARQLHQAETRYFADLYPCTVGAQRVAQDVFHLTLVTRAFHIDKVDDDQAAKVAQTQLPGGFFRSFQIGAEGGLFNVGPARGAGRVDVN